MIDKKIVVAVTLARGGSKSIPEKNIANIAGKPLLKYTVDEAIKSKYIDYYVVSTDSKKIKSIVLSMGVRVIDRPEELATDTSTSASSLIHAINQLSNMDIHYVVEVMATNPLKTHEDIDGCIEKLHNTGSDSVVSVCRVFDQHPSRVKYIDNDLMMDFYPETPETRRQDLTPEAYIRNGSIYAMKKKFLMNNHVRYDKRTRPYIMPSNRTINIDEPYDLLVAESIIKGRE